MTGPVMFYLPLDLLADGTPEGWGRDADRQAARGWTQADPPGLNERTQDRNRDRLGHRMRVLGAGLAWGRLEHEPEVMCGIVAEHARLLAIGIAPDEAPARRARVELTRELLGIQVVTVVKGDTTALDVLLSDAGGRPMSTGTAFSGSFLARMRERLTW